MIKMTDEREALLNRMIKVYGSENNLVVSMFANLCETMADNEINNKTLLVLTESHEQYPCKEDLTN